MTNHTPEAFERFLSRVVRQGECIVWTGAQAGRGYGQFSFKGQKQPAHRWIFEHFVRPLVNGELVCHHCDNPPCVKLAHLFVGSQSDNMRDALAKGRLRSSGLPVDPFMCQHGHTYRPENTYINPEGHRACRICQRAQDRKRADRSQQPERVEYMRQYHLKRKDALAKAKLP